MISNTEEGVSVGPLNINSTESTTFEFSDYSLSTESTTFEFSDYSQRAIVATMILITAVLGTAGNSLVILAVLLSRKLRTVTNAFVVNLSVADLVTSLLIPWHSVALLSTAGPPASKWLCGVVAVGGLTTVGCSIYTLASVGLNRLLLITRPSTTYRVVYTPKRIALWLAFCWLIPLLVIVLPPVFNVGALGFSRQSHFCGPDRSHPRAKFYDLIISATLYPIPLITVVVCYILIWRHLKRHMRTMAASPERPEDSSTANSYAVQSMAQMTASGTVNRPRITHRQTEITKNMFYVLCAFLLCLTPYAVCLFYPGSDPAKPYTAAIVLFNSCINPLIYATKHRDFKTVFSCIVRRQWDRIPEPSNSLKAMREMKCCGGSSLSA